MTEDKKKVRKRERPNNRKERVPLGAFRSKLSVPGELIGANEVGRWVNDKPGRLRDAELGGYEFVDDPEVKVGEDAQDGRAGLGTKVSRVVGQEDDGTPITAYLMVIDKDLYDQDQAEKLRPLEEVDKAIEEGAVEGAQGEPGAYYSPKGEKTTMESKLE